jgi:hypothetical protein
VPECDDFTKPGSKKREKELLPQKQNKEKN